MRFGASLLIVVLMILACLSIYHFGIWKWNRSGSQFIEYRGHNIRLSKVYYDFDTYKNDPSNIDPSETARVQKLVMEAPIAHSFPNRFSVFEGTTAIDFPGYGIGSGTGSESDGSELIAIGVEIPRAEKDRYFLFRAHDGRYELLDDFVEREIVEAYQIRHEGGYYIFVPESRPEAFRRPEPHE